MREYVTLLQCSNDCGRIEWQEEFWNAEVGSVSDAPTAHSDEVLEDPINCMRSAKA